MSLLLGGGYSWDKNTSTRLCAKNAGGTYARGGRICGTLQYKNTFNTQHKKVHCREIIDGMYICTPHKSVYVYIRHINALGFLHDIINRLLAQPGNSERSLFTNNCLTKSTPQQSLPSLVSHPACCTSNTPSM